MGQHRNWLNRVKKNDVLPIPLFVFTFTVRPHSTCLLLSSFHSLRTSFVLYHNLSFHTCGLHASRPWSVPELKAIFLKASSAL